jgi:hypothetical protein
MHFIENVIFPHVCPFSSRCLFHSASSLATSTVIPAVESSSFVFKPTYRIIAALRIPFRTCVVTQDMSTTRTTTATISRTLRLKAVEVVAGPRHSHLRTPQLLCAARRPQHVRSHAPTVVGSIRGFITPSQPQKTQNTTRGPKIERGVAKLFKDADEAVADIKSGSTILSAGFGLCGTAGGAFHSLARATSRTAFHSVDTTSAARKH